MIAILIIVWGTKRSKLHMTVHQRCVRQIRMKGEVCLKVSYTVAVSSHIMNLDQTSGDHSCGYDVLLKLQTSPTTAITFVKSVGNHDKPLKCQLTAYEKTSNSEKKSMTGKCQASD